MHASIPIQVPRPAKQVALMPGRLLHASRTMKIDPMEIIKIGIAPSANPDIPKTKSQGHAMILRLVSKPTQVHRPVRRVARMPGRLLPASRTMKIDPMEIIKIGIAPSANPDIPKTKSQGHATI